MLANDAAHVGTLIMLTSAAECFLADSIDFPEDTKLTIMAPAHSACHSPAPLGSGKSKEMSKDPVAFFVAGKSMAICVCKGKARTQLKQPSWRVQALITLVCELPTLHVQTHTHKAWYRRPRMFREGSKHLHSHHHHHHHHHHHPQQQQSQCLGDSPRKRHRVYE